MKPRAASKKFIEHEWGHNVVCPQCGEELREAEGLATVIGSERVRSGEYFCRCGYRLFYKESFPLIHSEIKEEG